MVILVDGYTDASTAKTAIGVIRYRTEEVVAVLDRGGAGKTSGQLLGVGGAIPVVAALADASAANTLLLGIAPPGGKVPGHWRPIVLEALGRGMTVVSGLHEFLADDPEFAQAAERHGATLLDLRRNDEHDVSHRRGIRPQCLRIHTIANDCSSGKMVAAVEIAQGLQRTGVDAAFVATGQTGILVAGSGCAVDRVISDFVAGAAEKLVLANQHHEVIVVEGQGSLFHPRYSGVTLSLLHGTMPHGLIACYEMGRKAVFGMPAVPLPSLRKVVDFYETAANLMHPCRVIGIAVNGIQFSDASVEAECARVEDEFQLPACDVIRHGPGKLVEAVRKMNA
jgi:uncharacterized NAD-dependent epimerase/dehydratase family protein